MVCNIRNESVIERVDTCVNELERIDNLIKGLGVLSPPVPFLIKYSIVRACGTIEFAFKNIISDVVIENQTKQLKQFIDGKIRHGSMNPTYSNMCGTLGSFDEEWKASFKKLVKDHPEKGKILDSLDSLNNARNAFAHGGSPSTSFINVQEYFEDAIKVLELFELSTHEA